MKKLFIFLLAAFLLVGMLSACANGDAQQDATDDTEATQEAGDDAAPGEEAADADDGPIWFHRFDPPITVTVNGIFSDPNTQWHEGEDHNWNNYVRWAENELGIIFEPAWVSADGAAEEQRLNIAIAGGDLPDFIQAHYSIAQRIIQAGLVREFGPLLEQYASPLTNLIIDDFQGHLADSFFARGTFEGRIYGMPTIGQADPWAIYNTLIWIRQDILNQLGMEVPTTIGEFEDFLMGAIGLDPSYVGLIIGNDLWGTQMAAFDPFGAAPFGWIEIDGRLEFGGIQPEVRQGLETLARWYENGLLDPEFVTRGYWDHIEHFQAANALAIQGPWWMYSWPMPDAHRSNPDAEFAVIPVLEGPDGHRQMFANIALGGNVAMVNLAFAHPEAAVFQLNEHLDSQFRDDLDLHAMLPDYEFKYPLTTGMGEVIGANFKPDNFDEIVDADGNFINTEGIWSFEREGPRFTFNTMSNPTQAGTRGFAIIERADQLGTSFRNGRAAHLADNTDDLSVADLINFGTIIENSGFNRQIQDAFYESVRTFDEVIMADNLMRFNQFFGAPTETMMEMSAYLDRLQQEVFVRIIMGEEPLERFDAFVQEWLDAGGREITEEVNEWFQAR